MEQYISKSAVVAEINRVIKSYDPTNEITSGRYALVCLRNFIENLEVKDVDLEKEIDKIWKPRFSLGWDDKSLLSISYKGFGIIARHFFELGLRSTITEEDCKLIWNIGDEIPNMSEEEFFKELLKRFKAQKGEEL